MSFLRIVMIAASVLSALHGALATDDPYLQKRAAMVRDQIEREGISDPRVLAAMRDVPRHLFVPPSFRARAYEPYPMPIGEGQTISQPYIVGLMTQILRLKETDRVLEVGTGSGYQAAVAARLAAEVYSVEILESLAARSRRTLSDLGFRNVVVRRGGPRSSASFAPAPGRGPDDHAGRRTLHDPEPRLHREGRPGLHHAQKRSSRRLRPPHRPLTGPPLVYPRAEGPRGCGLRGRNGGESRSRRILPFFRHPRQPDRPHPPPVVPVLPALRPADRLAGDARLGGRRGRAADRPAAGCTVTGPDLRMDDPSRRAGVRPRVTRLAAYPVRPVPAPVGSRGVAAIRGLLLPSRRALLPFRLRDGDPVRVPRP